jgi:hypothetical protein
MELGMCIHFEIFHVFPGMENCFVRSMKSAIPFGAPSISIPNDGVKIKEALFRHVPD